MNVAGAGATAGPDGVLSSAAPAEVLVEHAEMASRRIRLSLTSKCNFRCFFCHNEGQPRDDGPQLEIEDYERLAGAFRIAGITSIKLTGGEPLIYRSGGRDAANLVAVLRDAYSDAVLDLSITTNGWYLGKHLARLREAGLTRVTVSLSSLNAATHAALIQGRRGSPSVVLKAIEQAVTAGLAPVKVNTVMFGAGPTGPGNLHELPEIIRTCRAAGARELRLYPILRATGNREFEQRYEYWNDETMALVAQGLRECARETDVQRAEGVLADMAAGHYDSIAAASRFTLFVPVGEDFRLAFNMMSAYRGAYRRCGACAEPESCQEGMYALRLSASGEFRTCLNAAPSAEVGELLRSRASDDLVVQAVCRARDQFVLSHTRRADQLIGD